jgi:hypothetical protein
MNEILFLGATSALTGVTIMGMEMRRAMLDGIVQGYVTLQPLMQIPRLRNVDGRPITVRQRFGINVNTGQRAESCVQWIDREWILLAGLSGPIVGGGRGAIRMRVATE